MGINVTLTCAASGADNLQYQWMRVGKKTIPSRAIGVYSSTLAIPNIMVEDRGKYKCAISSGNTSVTSRPGIVSVLSKLLIVSRSIIYIIFLISCRKVVSIVLLRIKIIVDFHGFCSTYESFVLEINK